ncbi:MAG TPA: MFS transporter [Thermoplasmata archaeon]|nr:MFS transporter [Thermoplasmata archaeon]
MTGSPVPSSPPGIRRLMIHGPRGAFRWTAYALAATSFAAAIPTPLYPLYEERLHFSAGVLGLAFAAYTPGVFLTLFFLAPHAEQLGRKNLLYVGMAFTILAAIVFESASGVLWLALARFIAGFAVGATTSVATAAMSDLEPYRDQHHVARVAVAANFGGFAVGATLSGFLVEYAPDPTRLVYLLPVVASLIGVLAIAATPETAPEIGSRHGFHVQRVSVPAEVRRPFWVAVGGIAACYSIYGLFAALIPSYVRGGLRISSPLAAAAIVALMFGTAAIAQLGTSQIRDRRALLVGFPLMIGTLVALVLILPLTAWELVVVVTAALGASVGLTFMGSVTLVDRVASEDARGEMLAGFYLAGYLALAVPTIGVAEASEQIGLTSAGVLFGIVLALAVALLYWGIHRTPTPPGGGGRPRDRHARA